MRILKLQQLTALSLLVVTACSAGVGDNPVSASEAPAASVDVPATSVVTELGSTAVLRGEAAPVTRAAVRPLDDTSTPQIPPEIAQIAAAAQTVMSIYSGVGTAISMVTAFLKMMNVLPSVDSTAQQFTALNQHLDAAAGALNWYEQQATREDRLNKQYTAIDTVGEAVKLGTTVPVTTSAVSDSMNAAYDAEGDTAFDRYYTDASTDGKPVPVPVERTNDTYQVVWKNWIFDRQANANGFAYDWRLGVPELLELLALRIQVIAGVDPNFQTDGAFNVELERHRQALLKQYANMVNGVRCNSIFSQPSADDPTDYAMGVSGCADINTGVAAFTATLGFDGDAQAHMDFHRRELLNQMPLAQMRAMIDQLYAYQHSAPDLAALNGRIAPAATPSLCLGVAGGANTPGASLALSACNDSDAQHWSYDRKAGTILNVPFNRCLDVQNASFSAGASAVINDCNGTPSQHWTYDPGSQVIQNGLGTVLDIQDGTIQAGTPVWLWDRNQGDAQRWLADPDHMYTRFDLFGVGTDNRVYHQSASSDGSVAHGSWTSWGNLGTVSGSLAAVSWGPGRIDLFAIGSQNHLMHGFVDSTGSTCTSVNHAPCVDDWGTYDGFPSWFSVSSWGPQHLDLFSIEKVHTNPDEPQKGFAMLFQRTYDHGTGTGWVNRGMPAAGINSAPAAVSSTPGTVDVFVIGSDGMTISRGTSTNNSLQWSTWRGPFSYQGQQKLWTNGIAVSSSQPGQFDVLVSDGQQLFNCGGTNGVAWGTCTPLGQPGSVSLDNPAAVTPMDAGQFVAAAVGSDGQGWMKGFSTTQDMGPWASTGPALNMGRLALTSCSGAACAASNGFVWAP